MTTSTSTMPIFKRRESDARSYCRGFDTVFTSAKNAEMTDAQGRTYIDFLAGCSSLNYGHNDPDMKAALVDYIMDDGVAHGLDMHTGAKGAFIETFETHILKPRSMDHKLMFVGPTGANAVEVCLGGEMSGRMIVWPRIVWPRIVWDAVWLVLPSLRRPYRSIGLIAQSGNVRI